MIAYKVFTIPMTHDEVATSVHYYNYSVWQIMMYPDQWPNNHILNTLLTKLFINIGGKEQWVVRLPNLLFFIVYCIAVYRILYLILSKKHLFFIAGASLFLSSAYLLDFFGLCRGYGMSSSLATLSCSFILSAFLKNKSRHIWYAYGLAALASYANFSLLIFWASVGVITIFYFLSRHQKNYKRAFHPIVFLGLISAAYSSLIYVPLYKMTSTNQLQYWSSNGFYQETIVSLVENWRYNEPLILCVNTNNLSFIIATLVVISFIISIWYFIDRKWDDFKKSFAVVTLILCVSIFISVLQSSLFDIPSLSGRTGLFFYPLFCVLLVGVLSLLHRYLRGWSRYILAIGLPILCLWHLITTYTPNSTREWWYDAHTFEVLDYLKDTHCVEDKISLNVNWLFHRSFFFYADTDKTPWLELYPYDKDIDPDSDADYYYVMDSDLEMMKLDYEKIKKLGWDMWLLKRVEK